MYVFIISVRVFESLLIFVLSYRKAAKQKVSVVYNVLPNCSGSNLRIIEFSANL